MKLVYAVDKISYNDNNHAGVVKKVEAHLAQFQKNGIETTLCQYVWENGYPQITIEENTDILYFRRIAPSMKLIIKLFQLKKLSPNLRIIMEIPTYPFVIKKEDKSLKKTVNRILGLQLLRFCVDRITLVGQPVSSLYGIPVICMNNGVDYERVMIKNVLDTKGEIHMIGVSGCTLAHGYDRVIEGMYHYYKKNAEAEKVVFHVVGEGRCEKEYKSLAAQYGLIDKKIIFYGMKTGEELDAIYDKCNIGLVSLGTYRTKITYSSSLKAREYAAKGIPMIVDVELDINNKNTNQYILEMSSEDAPIDIQKIVEFYHNIYDDKDKQEIAAEIRETFYPYCDWKFVFQDVISYIEKGAN